MNEFKKMGFVEKCKSVSELQSIAECRYKELAYIYTNNTQMYNFVRGEIIHIKKLIIKLQKKGYAEKDFLKILDRVSHFTETKKEDLISKVLH